LLTTTPSPIAAAAADVAEVAEALMLLSALSAAIVTIDCLKFNTDPSPTVTSSLGKVAVEETVPVLQKIT
jgi:hypothetical protein